jgi:hypothetical protein
MVNEIKAWIKSSCKFVDGVQLYQKYGTNESLKKLFALGESPYNKKKLHQELEQILNNAPKQLNVLEQIKQKPAPAPVSSYPEPVQSWYKSALELLDLNKDRKTKLGLLMEEALQKYNPEKQINKLNAFLKERGSEQLVHEHLDSCFREGKLWEKISYWRKTGKLPPEEPVIPSAIIMMDMHNLILRRNVLRSRISQCKKRKAPRKYTAEARADFRSKNKKLLGSYQEELVLIETRINELV